MIPISEAFELIAKHATRLSPVETPLLDSVGRVLAAEVRSDVDSPPHDKSMMDGFAVRSADISAGTRKLAVIETIAAGAWPEKTVGPGEASRIMTGAPLPEGADAVVMIEQTEFDAEQQVVTINAEHVPAGKSMMARKTTMAAGQTVFEAGHTIRATDIGLLAECGAHTVSVSPYISAAILPTGDELVQCDTVPGRGQIRNSNGPMLVAMARATGMAVTDLGIGVDDKEKLAKLVSQGLENDLLILSGGVSMGEFDLVPGILAEAGVEQVFHKVAVKPGKPIWFGVLKRETGRTTFVFGLPGNPVSSMVGFHLFVRTAIRSLSGVTDPLPVGVAAELVVEHETRGGRPTYWPGRWVADEGTARKVEPLLWRGSSDLKALGQAEVLIHFGVEKNQHPAGGTHQVFSL